jgi:hypothetical protein
LSLCQFCSTSNPCTPTQINLSASTCGCWRLQQDTGKKYFTKHISTLHSTMMATPGQFDIVGLDANTGG